MKLCFECDSKKELTKHHVVPRILGGKRTLLLCASCHGKVHDCKKIGHSKLTRIALSRMKADGKRISRTPFGFNLAKDGVSLVKNPAEQKIIKDILEMRDQGLSFPKIAQSLTERGIITKRGKTVWEHSTIRGLVKRHGKKRKKK